MLDSSAESTYTFDGRFRERWTPIHFVSVQLLFCEIGHLLILAMHLWIELFSPLLCRFPLSFDWWNTALLLHEYWWIDLLCELFKLFIPEGYTSKYTEGS